MENSFEVLVERLKNAEAAVPKDSHEEENRLMVLYEHIELCDRVIQSKDEKIAILRRLLEAKKEKNKKHEEDVEKLLEMKETRNESIAKLHQETIAMKARNEELASKKNDYFLEFANLCIEGTSTMMTMHHNYSDEKSEIELQYLYDKIEKLQQEYDMLKEEMKQKRTNLPSVKSELENSDHILSIEREELDTVRGEYDKITKNLQEIDAAFKYLDEEMEQY